MILAIIVEDFPFLHSRSGERQTVMVGEGGMEVAKKIEVGCSADGVIFFRKDGVPSHKNYDFENYTEQM